MLKKSWILRVVVIMLSLLLVGCGNNNEIKEDTADEENIVEVVKEPVEVETVALDVESNPALRRGNVLTVAQSGFDGIFNPVLYSSDPDSKIVDLVFNSLIKINSNGEYVADLATWDVSDDKLTYTFSIIPGIKFHNGQELTAADVAFTYYVIADIDYDGPRGSLVQDIQGVKEYRIGESDSISGIKIVDDYTISFTIKEPNVKKLADFCYGILNEDYYSYQSIEGLRSKNVAPVGTGPMKFELYELGQYVELSTFDDYFEGRPYIDGVIYKVIPDDFVAEAINAGEVDVARASANLYNYDTMTEAGIAEVQEYLGNSYRYIGFNLRLDKFSDKRVRQALWYGLNVKDYVDAQWQGFAAPCLGPISPVSWAYPDTDDLTVYDFNPSKAKDLLKEAGWTDTDGDGFLDKDGQKFTIEWTSYTEFDWPINLINLAKENWGDLGIEVTENMMDFHAVTDTVYVKQDFEVYNMSWNLSLDPDPTDIFGEEADVPGGYNAVGYYNARANEIFRLGRGEYDQGVRQALYNEWMTIANDDVPYIFISIGTVINGVNNRVHNLELDTYEDVSKQILDIELDYID
ncbi:hypothetical protein EZV73_22545 [Acidaminobacter sp. JC074]|uniref:ABC transporter substrate-binding protein n=1 Tax=Acidaminobacter sp. JC074 TaxID=2530199 RepID=UPI001F0CFAFF|nr:ABC transporter substrate-binding protein [Acidaminobacter sp. JC074]MCH4890380.1 hypothetical protein [Acidaminobacter sp. JC074]